MNLIYLTYQMSYFNVTYFKLAQNTYIGGRGIPEGSVVKNLRPSEVTQVWSLGQ